jgi:DNA-binding NarL/FixJ family response regulator
MALRQKEDIRLLGDFGTAERALHYLQKTSAESHPDIILLDLNLPGMQGLEALRWLREYAPRAKVIVLTQSHSEEDIFKAIVGGASGYLLKSSTLDQISESIRMVSAGGSILDAEVAGYIRNQLMASRRKAPNSQLLSERELDVLMLLAEGLVKKEIADRLAIEVSTVVSHVSNIYTKLQVHNAPAAVSKAFREGIL